MSSEELRRVIYTQVGSSLWLSLLANGLDGDVRSHELPPISIVVCTRDRSALLGKCLRTLAALDYPAFEIIVVDNAPASDETERLVSDSQTQMPLRYTRENRPGLDWARNRGSPRRGMISSHSPTTMWAWTRAGCADLRALSLIRRSAW